MKRLTIIILLAAAVGMVSCSAVRHCKAPDVDLPERIAVMEPLAQDPTDASARLRLYELRDLLQEDA